MTVALRHLAIGHVADDLWGFEQVAGVTCVEERDVAAGLDSPGADVVEHACQPFGRVDGADEYAFGLRKLPDRGDTLG